MTRFSEPEKRQRGSWMLPAMGLLLIISFGVFAYFLGDPVRDFVATRFNVAGIGGSDFEWIFRALIFIALSLIGAMIYAAAAPKRKKTIDERTLVKQRQEIRDYQKQRRQNIRNIKNLEKRDRQENTRSK